MNSTRCYSLDFLKVAATTAIVFHHYQQVTGAHFERGINYWEGGFYFGYIVELFFLLSGYFMFGYISKIQKGLTFKSFFLKRFRRLAPMLTLAALTYEVLLYFYRCQFGSDYCGVELSLWGGVIDSLGVQAGWVFANPSINNPTWYVSVLLFCYILFYLGTKGSARLRISARYCYLFIIFVGCAINTYSIDLPFLNAFMSRGYVSFFAGVLLGSYVYEKTFSNKAGGFALLIVGLFVVLFKTHFNFIETGFQYLLTFIVYPALIISLKTEIASKVFRHPIWGKAGGTSFSVYLFHCPCFILMFVIFGITNFDANYSSHALMYSVTLIVWVLGSLIYVFIEPRLDRVAKDALSKL